MTCIMCKVSCKRSIQLLTAALSGEHEDTVLIYISIRIVFYLELIACTFLSKYIVFTCGLKG